MWQKEKEQFLTVFIYVIKVSSFATNFAKKTMFSEFFSVCYLLRKSSLIFLFFYIKFHMIRIYSYTCRNSRPEVACNKRDSGIGVFVFEVFKNIFFNRHLRRLFLHMISFCSVFQKKESAPKSVYISFSRLKFSFNLQFLFFI